MMANQKIKLIQFDDGRFQTPFEFVVKARAQKIAEEEGGTAEARYTQAVKEMMDYDSRWNGGELSRQHDRLVLAFNERNPRYLANSEERLAVGKALRMADHFSAEQAKRRAGAQIANGDHPFIELVERILKEKFKGERAFYSQAMDLAQAQDRELAKDYVARTFPRIGELQKPESEGGIPQGTRNNDYPQRVNVYSE